MNILIDTNVLLDVLADRKPFSADSAFVWKFAEASRVRGFISVLSVPNIVYIMRRELGSERIGQIINGLFRIFDTADLTAEDELTAAAMRWNDFEDALQAVASQKVNAEYIVTRNTADYTKSPVPAVTPAEFLKLIN